MVLKYLSEEFHVWYRPQSNCSSTVQTLRVTFKFHALIFPEWRYAAMITGTTEFYISLMDHTSWAGAHTVWGKVISWSAHTPVAQSSSHLRSASVLVHACLLVWFNGIFDAGAQGHGCRRADSGWQSVFQLHTPSGNADAHDGFRSPLQAVI